MGKTVKYNGGYSLVEVIVAAVFFVIAIVGTISILAQGTKVNRDDLIKVKAYQQLERVLESQFFSWANYDTLRGRLTVSNPVTITLPGTVLDQRPGGNISATRWVVLYAADYSAAASNAGMGINSVPAIKIKAFIAWSQEAGRSDTAKLETIITKP